jgi:hypothetical protein
MARIRTIKPDFWESESIGRLSMGARLLCIASLNMADDEGLLRWNEAYLMSQAFVYDELSIESISEWMRELVTEQIIFPYKAGSTNQRLGWIINFRTHQVINRPQPSKLPPPSIQNSDFKNAIYMRDKNTCHLCGGLIELSDPHNIVGSKAPSLDHINPVSLGGNDYPSNLKVAHISCNKSRRNLPLNDSVNDSLSEGKGREGNIKRLIPVDFSISERVLIWAKEKGHNQLETHLENFISYCKKQGYKYVDWDEAFMEAIRKNWAGVQKNKGGVSL